MPGPTPPSTGPSRSAELTDRIGYLLKHVQIRFQEIQREALSPLGLDGRLLAVLIVAGDGGPHPQLRLAETLGVDRTTMVDLVDRLEASGWVQRRPDPDDRRTRLVELTPQGRKVLAAGVTASHTVEQRFLAPLADGDRLSFRDALQKLV
jgi:DNA-binding MarR family transcriptional regulator